MTPTTSGASATGATSTTGVDASTGGSSETGGFKFDLPAAADLGTGECVFKCGETDWSYVWIANSGEHTLSKIDTRSMAEVGRYITRADQQGNPSRTSASIDAKAVAVANRAGGLMKVWARPEYCTDKNGNGKIDTSTGKADLLPFDMDECVAWFTAFPDATSQRARRLDVRRVQREDLRIRGPEDLDRGRQRDQGRHLAVRRLAGHLRVSRRWCHRRRRGHHRHARDQLRRHLRSVRCRGRHQQRPVDVHLVGRHDAETMMVGDKVTLPIDGLARGIGVDVDGYIWAVMLGGNTAYRIHPDTYEIASYDGLNAPYTYSDMGGGQINNVICNPQG